MRWRRRSRPLDPNRRTLVDENDESEIRAMSEVGERVLIVHPDIDNFALIKAEAARLNMDVVKGNRDLIKPGEAYIFTPDAWLKKETWQ